MWLLLLLCFSSVAAVPPVILEHFSTPLAFHNELNLTAEVLKDLIAAVSNQTWKDLNLLHLTARNSLSASCLASLTEIILKNESLYPLKLADSWPKLPAGLMRKGPFFLLGDYDQCLELMAAASPPVHYSTLFMEARITNRILPLTVGFCLPTDCDEAAIRQLLALWIEKSKIEEDFKLNTIIFQSNESSNLTKILLGASISLIFLLIIAGTWMDAQVRKEQESEQMDEEMGSERDTQQPVYNAPSIALTFRSVRDIKRIDKATLIDILCAFSIRISLNHLFRNSAREVSVLHGIKILSAFWIILGHCCLFSLPYMDTVLQMSPEKFSPWLSSLLFNSSLAVDSFLFITGTVLAYTVHKRILFRGNRDKSRNTAIRILLFYFHRVARLWPALLLFSAFMIYFYSTLGDGPLWRQDGIFGAQCTSADVVRHLAFFSNFSPSLCLPWLWHISLDFQLYLISPIFLFFLSKRNRYLYLGAAVIIAASLFYRAFVLLFFNLPTNFFLGMLKENRYEESELSFKLLYGCPLSRCPPFVIGLISGWLICLPQAKTKLHWLSAFSLKVVAYSSLLFAVFSPFEEGPAAVLHAVVHRTVWAVGLALLVWLAENNQHQYLQYILASPRLLPISRLSFGIYLTHEPILLWIIWTQRQPSSASSFSHFILLAVTVSALSLIAAFFFAICFELPISNIERRLFKKTDCRFNRKKNRCQKKREGTILNFTEKTTLWLENADNPYAGILQGDQEISSFSEERFIEKVALIKPKKKKKKAT